MTDHAGTRGLRGVDVWLLALDDPVTVDPRAVLDARELGRGERLMTGSLRQRYVSSHVQLRLVLAGYLDVEPGAVPIDRTCRRCGDQGHGRPRLALHPELHFSLSRSHGRAVLAVSGRTAIGADIELIDEKVDVRKVAELALAPSEIGQGAVWERWAMKEACTKASGAGLATSFSSIELRAVPFPGTGGAGCEESWWEATQTIDDSPEWLDMRACVRSHEGAVVALAGPSMAGPVRWIDADLVESGTATRRLRTSLR